MCRPVESVENGPNQDQAMHAASNCQIPSSSKLSAICFLFTNISFSHVSVYFCSSVQGYHNNTPSFQSKPMSFVIFLPRLLEKVESLQPSRSSHLSLSNEESLWIFTCSRNTQGHHCNMVPLWLSAMHSRICTQDTLAFKKLGAGTTRNRW